MYKCDLLLLEIVSQSHVVKVRGHKNHRVTHLTVPELRQDLSGEHLEPLLDALRCRTGLDFLKNLQSTKIKTCLVHTNANKFNLWQMHEHLADGAAVDGVGDNDLAGKVFAPLAHERRKFWQLDARENARLAEVLGVAGQRREPQTREVGAVRLLGLQVEVVPDVQHVVPVLLVAHLGLVHDHQLQPG